MKDIYDMIIIGGGPGGYTAALYGARAGLSVLVIEKMTVGGQMALTGSIENYPGIEDIDGFELGAKMQAQAERYGAKTLYGEVKKVRLSDNPKSVITDTDEYLAKTVVIASGAKAKELGIDGESEYTGRGIHYCAHCDGRFYKDKTVAVVGGGNSAVGDALYLKGLCKKVYLIHRRDTLRATKIHSDAVDRAKNIEFVKNSLLKGLKFSEKDNAIVIKNTESGEESELEVDAVFVSIGREPNTEIFAPEIKLDDSGYIIAGEGTKTNIDGVYAVGDVRTKELRQIVTAVSDGAVAAHFIEKYINGTL